MTVTEFGRRLGVSRTTAYCIVATGDVQLTDVRASGKKPRLRITEEALTDFLRRRAIPQRPGLR